LAFRQLHGLLANLLAVFSQHPTLGLNPAQPVLERRDPAQVLENVLLAGLHSAGTGTARGGSPAAVRLTAPLSTRCLSVIRI